MAYSESANKATQKYKKEHLKRVPLEIKKDDYDVLKAAADAKGEKVNEYIKKAIRMRMDSDTTE